MKHRLWWLLLPILVALATPPAHAEESLKRHVLLVSANDGGSGRIHLRYAQADAEAMERVLVDLGGVDLGDVVRVDQANLARLHDGLAELKRRIATIASTGRRQEVVFYYSGHSDEAGLLLSGERLSYPELRKMVGGLSVDVRLMILDSCASGQLTASKGGVKRAPFLVDSSVRTKGQAVITSASANEAAQESERIHGSFFTHYFVSGLRGAADANGDGKVTLSEAYQYAYANTLARTETTLAGAQHPAYDFELAGTGDLVLTDLRTSPAVLDFPKPLSGRYFVRDAGDSLVAEIRKQPGQPVKLGLERGVYTITSAQEGRYAEARADLSANEQLDVGALAFVGVEGEPAVARGDAPASGAPGTGAAPREYKQKRWSFQLVPSFADDAPEAGEEHTFAFGLLGGRSGELSGFSLAFGGYLVDEGGAEGGMISLGLNWDKGPLHGFQIAFGNYAAGAAKATQIGLVNWAGVLTSGAQIGLISWSGGATSGVQASVVSVAKGDLAGAQFAYVGVATGKVTGAQVDLVAVAAGGAEGAQVGLVEYAGDVDGAQVGFVEVAGTVDGAQVGFANLASSASTQVGLLNIAAKQTDVQVGLVNYADQVDDFSLGLVSYAGNGRLDAEAWLDELGFTHASLRMGSKNLYTIYDYGDRSWIGSSVPEHRRQTAGLGLGTQADFGPLSLGLEMMGNDIQDQTMDGGLNSYVTLRALAAYRLVSKLAIFAGPDLGYYPNSRSDFRSLLADSFRGRAWGNSGDTRWIGYAAGLRWAFKN